MSLLREVPQFRFDSGIGDWVQYRPPEPSFSILDGRSLSLRLASYNVLFDIRENLPHKPKILCHPLRYEKILGLVFGDELDSTPIISCFNEATTGFVAQLKENPHIRRLGCVISNNEGWPWFGNFICSSVPFAQVYEVDLSRSSGPNKPGMVALFDVADGDQRRFPLAVATIHLSSSLGDVLPRKRELAEFCRVLQESPEMSAVENVLIMGDMNFHGPDDDRNIPEGFRDLWTVLNPQASIEESFTFNSRVNTMHHWEWPTWSGGQYRLDRWFLKSHGLNSELFVEEMAIHGNQPFDVHREEGEDAPKQLFPSDHFGLKGKCTLVLSSD